MNRLTRAVLTWHRARRIRKRLIPWDARSQFHRLCRAQEVRHLQRAHSVHHPHAGVRLWTSDIHGVGLTHMEWEGGPVLYERPVTGRDCVGVELVDRRGRVHAMQYRWTP